MSLVSLIYYPTFYLDKLRLASTEADTIGQCIKDIKENEARPRPTIDDLRAAIPSTCFRSSLSISFIYLARDLCYTCTLIYATSYIDIVPYAVARFSMWALYGFLQGCVWTGLWIIAHECGHGAFTPYSGLNSFLGWVLHSSLLVPFFSWKITHARHHRFTNHMEKDTAFAPLTEASFLKSRNLGARALAEMVEDTPIMTLITLAAHQLLGMPLYLFCYLSGGKDSKPLGSALKPKIHSFEMHSHFNPFSQIFLPSQRSQVILSDIGILIVAGLLYFIYSQFGFFQVFLLYFIPYLWVNHWIVAITYLQHTHPSVPHYSGESWNYLKGALSTIDRSMGFLGRHFFHEIIDYHVVHHLFSKIPFYHAEEATLAIMPVLGDLYRQDKRNNFLGTLWSTFCDCYYVAEATDTAGKRGSGVYYWRKIQSAHHSQ